jgi:hypothetical protein
MKTYLTYLVGNIDSAVDIRVLEDNEPVRIDEMGTIWIEFKIELRPALVCRASILVVVVKDLVDDTAVVDVAAAAAVAAVAAAIVVVVIRSVVNGYHVSLKFPSIIDIILVERGDDPEKSTGSIEINNTKTLQVKKQTTSCAE